MSIKMNLPAPRVGFAHEQAKGSQRFWAFFLVICIIQVSGAWYFRPAVWGGVETMQTEKVYGVPFQYSVWLMILATLGYHVWTNGISKLSRVLSVFFPFWIVGMIAAVFGAEPFASVRYIALWSLIAFAGAVIGTELSARSAVFVLSVTLLVLLLVSAAMSLLVPSIGTQVYASTNVWRGVFTNKNQLGWIAALTLVLVFSMGRRQSGWLVGLTSLVALVCLIASGSKGALVAVVCTLLYRFLVAKLVRHVTPGFGVGVVVFFIVVAAIFGGLVFPYVLEALGRDLTLTGRTEVWRTFFDSMSRTPWIGQGPGAYTSLSSLTLPLARKLQFLGAIVTPHNVFLGVFGDAGLFGLVTFIVLMFYLAIVMPFTRPTTFSVMSAAVASLMISHGMVETHEILSPGPAWFFLILTRALAMNEADEPAAAEPDGAAAWQRPCRA